MDNDENLAEMFLDIFYYHLYVNDLTIYEALARRATIGHIAGVDVGVEFMSRIEMYLISFHGELIRGILLGMYHGIEVAASVVAVFHLHNFLLNGNLIIYGGEGYLREANQMHVRVLDHQHWTCRNLFVVRSFEQHNVVRLVRLFEGTYVF
jgi:hypothetical protein